jgi:hypothetical protein
LNSRNWLSQSNYKTRNSSSNIRKKSPLCCTRIGSCWSDSSESSSKIPIDSKTLISSSRYSCIREIGSRCYSSTNRTISCRLVSCPSSPTNISLSEKYIFYIIIDSSSLTRRVRKVSNIICIFSSYV